MELVPVEELRKPEAQLAECYRLSGADSDGDDDAHLAKHAVQAVRELREQSDANNLEELELREKAEQRLEKLERWLAERDPLWPDSFNERSCD